MSHPRGKTAAVGKNSKKRRDAKRKERPNRPPTRPAAHARAGPEDPELQVQRLVADGLAALREPFDFRAFNRAVDSLVDLDGVEGPCVHRPERALADLLAQVIGTLWEHGWEPVDMVHVVRREANARMVRLVTAAIADEASTSENYANAPARWLAQLDALAVTRTAPQPTSERLFDLPKPVGPPPTSPVIDWRLVERIGVADSIESSLRLLGLLQALPRITALDDPPSQWGRAAPRPSPSGSSSADPKLLSTIRALLAKAESTSFPAEAEAFTAKAQDLMSRHAIDAAVLASKADHDATLGVGPRRVHIDNPYGKEKAQLLGVVSHVNRVRVVWDDQLGFATIVGFEVDLELVEMLFTSLLVQATGAVTAAKDGSAHSRSPSFRRAFLLAYSSRIGERLRLAGQEANANAASEYGTALVPILEARREAVATVTQRLFPHSAPMRGRMVDARGWAAGKVAADRADLGAPAGRIGRG